MESKTVLIMIPSTILVVSNVDNKIGLNRRETFIMQMKKLLSKVLAISDY